MNLNFFCSLALVTLCVINSGYVCAHELLATIGARPNDGLTFTATCSPNSYGKTHAYFFQIEGKTINSPFLAKMMVVKNGLKPSVDDPTSGDGQPGAFASLAGGDGVYTLVVGKKLLAGQTSESGSMQVAITSYCQAANGEHTAQQMSAPIPIQIPSSDFMPMHLLKITNSGGGVVTSAPTGINCGSTCSHSFSENLIVTLSATSDNHSKFVGWYGEGCGGFDVCTVTMNSAKNISALFISPDKPSSPTEVSSSSGNARATVSWKASSGIVDGYWIDIYDSRSGDPIIIRACDVKPPNTSCEVQPLGNGAMYRFRVTAYGPGGTSEPSNFSPWVVPGSSLVNAQCGTANGVLSNDQPSQVDLCLAGLASVPEQDASKVYSWSCVGIGGGASINCRTGGPLPVYPEPTAKLYVTLKTKNPQFKSGVVKSDPLGVDCGTRCGYSFTKGAKITLTATPQDGAKFNGWSGACSNKKLTCTFKLRNNMQVTAKFK